MMKINAKILNNLVTPDMLQPSTPGSAGIDLRAVNLPDIDGSESRCYVYPNQCIKIGTGIAIHIADPGYAAMILPRSGLGHKTGLVLGNLVGLIDSDYQGELMISAWNRSHDTILIKRMDRIAQLVIIPVMQPAFNFVKSFEETERGDGGFGSTGVSILGKD